MSVAGRPLGLVAGAGRYPLAVLREAHRAGRRIVAVALRRVAVAAVAQEADACRWLEVGQIDDAARFFAICGAREVILAGGVPWRPLAVRPRPHGAAWRALMKATMEGAGDDRLLRHAAAAFESRGLVVVGPGSLAAHLIPRPGLVGGPPLPSALAPLVDAAFDAARALGRRDRGQAVVASERGVLLEGRAGTDALVARAGRGPHRGGVLAKTAKPGQDVRFDLPAIGPATVAAAARAGLRAVAIEAGATLIIDRPDAAALADRLGVTLLAVLTRV
jgi:hypothetical protein